MFVRVDLLVRARSHLSAYSVLLNFKFAGALANPMGAGGGRSGREGVPAAPLGLRRVPQL